MPRDFRWTVRWLAFGLLMAAPILLAQTAPPAAKPHHKTHKTAKPLVLPPLPPGPLSQVPMDQLPATPAMVSYQNGLLAISAQNSTLGEILRDVRKLTGTTIDIPPGSGANERVVTHLGPGAPWDILTRLLNGSSFNYIMLGSSSDPTTISSVVLTAKTSSAAAAGTQTAANDYKTVAPAGPQNRPTMLFNQMPVTQPVRGATVVQPAVEPEEADAKDEEENADDNANADDQNAQPEQPGINGANPGQPQADPNQPNAGPRTPEQILEMMRRQQPGNPLPPPQPPQE
jgi:hypothetical protein